MWARSPPITDHWAQPKRGHSDLAATQIEPVFDQTEQSGSAVAAAASLAVPAIAKAQSPVSMRWQSTWPAKDILHAYALDFFNNIDDMTGDDLKIEVLPDFGLLDAVSKGTLDGGHGVLDYRYGKRRRWRCGVPAPAMRWTPTCCCLE